MKLTFIALLAVAVGVSACATLPEQVGPTSPDPFVGKWIGSWQDAGGASGTVEELTIEAPRNEALQYSVRLTNAFVPGFSGEAKFAGGELVAETSTLSMVFRLHEDDRLEASYHNRGNNEQGVWSLTRTALTTAELIEKLVRGSPWTGEYGPYGAFHWGTCTVGFSLSGGSLNAELISITGLTPSKPGPHYDLRVKGDKLSFKGPWPRTTYFEFRLKGDKLEGRTYGSRIGWVWLLPSNQ